MARKTVKVDDVRLMVNGLLAKSDPEMTRERAAMSHVLEMILMDAGQYRGFRYLEIAYGVGDEPHDFGDETRREYL